jgi:RHS repeat-associated protein
MISFNGTALTYDANGNLSNDGTNTYTWDERNRLVGMSGSPAGAASFAYDPFGRRASKTVGGATTQFQYDGNRVVQEIQAGAGNVLTNMGFSRTDTAGNMTFLGDDLGSTLALSNDAGVIDTQYSYEPFGTATASGAPSTNPYQFAFHQNDGTGLYYYSARYYSPTLARFISEDPSGTRGGINLYEYAGDQPVTFEDSSGLSPSDGSGSCRPCTIYLRSHSAFWGLADPERHYFWETLDSGDQPGNRQFDSGTWSFPWLNETTAKIDDTESDPPSNKLGPSTEYCDKVEAVRKAGAAWPNDSIVYWPPGPNSNTVASFINILSGVNFPEPPDSEGWTFF